MPVAIKFCGLTRAEDAQHAVALGAAYAGVIFAESPRRVEPAVASAVIAPARGRAQVAGVFGPSSLEAVAETAGDVGLDVVQLHGDPSPGAIERMRPFVSCEVWGVIRVGREGLGDADIALMSVADAVVLDARVPGRLGGTGVPFDWRGVARALDRQRVRSRIVLAGGLTADNVADAIRIIAPDVVDVSSGVESAPGIKDHARMRAFTEAVAGRGASQ